MTRSSWRFWRNLRRLDSSAPIPIEALDLIGALGIKIEKRETLTLFKAAKLEKNFALVWLCAQFAGTPKKKKRKQRA